MSVLELKEEVSRLSKAEQLQTMEWLWLRFPRNQRRSSRRHGTGKCSLHGRLKWIRVTRTIFEFMKISYDPEVDALSITFRETTVTTKHLAEGIAADYDSEGRLAGLEILDAQKRFGGSETMRRVELEGVGT